MTHSMNSASLAALIQALQPAVTRDSHTQSLEELREEEGIVSAVLLRLRNRINTLLPVDRLPPEILLHIFESLATPAVYHIMHQDRVKNQVQTRQLLTITHVCRKWREVALNAATLWTRVDDFKPDRLHAFLERSRSAALSIHLQAERAGSMTRLLDQCSDRLERLDITLHAGPLSRLPSLQIIDAPNLETFTVIAQPGLLVNVSDPTPLLFGVPASGLKALAIDPVHVLLPVNTFPHLTHLYLANLNGRLLSGDPMGRLLGFLSNTPALQYLHVEGLSRSAATTTATGTASLQALRALTCGSSDLQSALCLLSILDLPENVVVRLDRLECLTPDHIALARPLSCQALLASFTRLEVATEAEELHLIADGPRSGLWVQAECVDGEWGEWLARLCTMFPLPSVTTLQAGVVDSLIIPSLLLQLPHLRKVAVQINAGPLDEDEDAPSRELVASLYTTLSTANNLPHLEELVLGARAAHPDKLLPFTFLAMAGGRYEGGRPLRRLVIDLLDYWSGMELLAPISPDVDQFRAAFSPASVYVEDVQILVEAGACGFSLRGMWIIPEAERYWQIPECFKPEYRLPW